MSSPHRHLPPLEVRERPACMCAHGGACSTYAPGHALHLIQARLAAATPSEWVDAIVEKTDATAGTLTLRTLDEATRIVVWSGAGAASVVSEGTPVALHARYDVLAAGSTRFNVLR